MKKPICKLVVGSQNVILILQLLVVFYDETAKLFEKAFYGRLIYFDFDVLCHHFYGDRKRISTSHLCDLSYQTLYSS